MALDKSLKKVLILGSGPIVIGQACEFDYSGTQACKALMGLGLEVILVNSNPATIMTDPEIATRTYIEPLKADYIAEILRKEKPDGIIPTLGGQTALNLALELADSGLLDQMGIKLLGANPEVIRRGEDREQFREILDKIGAKYPKSFLVKSYEQGQEVAAELGLPIILRPNYTLGGGGGGIAYSEEEFRVMLVQALNESPTSEVLVEESILGWQEFELEVMRDRAGTFVVICAIENFDPCGVHTGDSITVAPQQTLSDKAYQAMRDEAQKIIDHVGIETGGANIQFAVDQVTGDRVVIEMNPRVSRSSALASKATGFPIAKIAALLAVGFEMEEITNDITKKTPTCYEPALDYVVTKVPRFAFEKFPGAKDSLTTQMRSVGEVMGIGRTLGESMIKALLSLENSGGALPEVKFDNNLLANPNSQRIFHLAQAFREGQGVEELHEITGIHPWFLEQLQNAVNIESEISCAKDVSADQLRSWKRAGFSDKMIAIIQGAEELKVREQRHKLGVRPNFSMVDTCAGEFESNTPYYYSTYWAAPESAEKVEKPRICVIGSGPNRIGQGIEFDYSCVRGVKQFQKLGVETIMVNSNPETVSTDYDTADLLFFEPLTAEHISEILEFTGANEFVPQLGGQTPINLAQSLLDRGHKIKGSSLHAIDLAEDRRQFSELCQSLGVKVPQSGMASEFLEAQKIAEKIGFPIMCRPSYVLGGRRMEVVENLDELEDYFVRNQMVINQKRPCLIDQFLDGALEVDVDLVRGKDWMIVGGILEHIEAAGVHSGDSMGVLPPQRLKPETSERIEELSKKLAESMDVIGLLNLQLAVKNDEVFVLEANPRSSRSVPFIAKATGVPLIDLGVWAMAGKLDDEVQSKNYDWRRGTKVCVKGVVFPFKKFPEADSILGPEMKSTGECMGRGEDYAEALTKAFVSSGMRLPTEGEVFLSLRDKDKEQLLPMIRDLTEMGFHLIATKGTAEFLKSNEIECEIVKKVHEGRPNCVDRLRSGKTAMVINTTSGQRSIEASFGIRRSCIDYSLPCVTESDAAEAFVVALKRQKSNAYAVDFL